MTGRPAPRPTPNAGRRRPRAALAAAALAAALAPAAAGAQGRPAPAAPAPDDVCGEALGPAGPGPEARLRAAQAYARAARAAGGPALGSPVGPAFGVARAPRAPRGYLGLRLSEVSEVAWTGEGRVVRYCAYPLVVSVEPASPAERAGVGAGDTLVAYGGRDLVRDGPVALDRLLTPGAVLRVRLRRDGRTLTRAVTVGRAPEPGVVTLGPFPPTGFGPSDGPVVVPPFRVDVAWPEDEGTHRRQQPNTVRGRVLVGTREGSHESVREGPGAEWAWPGGVAAARPAPGAPRPPRRPTRARPDGPPAADGDGPPLVIVDGVPLPPSTVAGLTLGRESARPLLDYLRALPAVPATAWAEGAPAALAGAQVVALDDDLREVLARGSAVDAESGPVRGVFVLKVLPGAAAAEAGLRAGDVVTAAGGRAVTSPAALQRVLAGRALAGRGTAGAASARAAAPRTVTLRVWRAGAWRDVALRW